MKRHVSLTFSINLDAKEPLELWNVDKKRALEIEEEVKKILMSSRKYKDAYKIITETYSDDELILAIAMFEFWRGIFVAVEGIEEQLAQMQEGERREVV